MTKLLIGFLLGIAVTATYFYVFEDGSDEQQVVPAVPTMRTGDASEADRSGSIDTTNADGEAVSESSEPSVRNEPTRYAVMPAEPSAYVDPTPSKRGGPSPSSMPPTTAPDRAYPPEIADMIENRVNKELQARYEADEREESWATYMEGQLGAYFASKPELAQFNFSMIDCRTTMCEVHVLGYGVDALTMWNVATADFVAQDWHDFNSMSMNRFNPQPDILAIVLIVSRQAE